MPNFSTRVELHGAVSKDYEDLHASMAKHKFYGYVKLDDDNLYELPPGEYTSTGNGTASDMKLAAEIAVSESWKKKYSLMVTKSDGSRAFKALKRLN